MSSQNIVYYVRYISVLLIGSTNLGFSPVEAWIFPQSLAALDFLCVCSRTFPPHVTKKYQASRQACMGNTKLGGNILLSLLHTHYTCHFYGVI